MEKFASCPLTSFVAPLFCIITSSLRLSFLFPTLSPPKAPCSPSHFLSPSLLSAPLAISSPALCFHHSNFKCRTLSPTPNPSSSFQSNLLHLIWNFAPSNSHPPLSFPGSPRCSLEQVGHSHFITLSFPPPAVGIPWFLLFFGSVVP